MLLDLRIGGSWSICWQASLVDSKMEFPNSSASCRILPRVHVICEYHFFWQENFTDFDRSFQKILKCPSVLRDLQQNGNFFTPLQQGVLRRRGESYPIGLWRNGDYAAATLMASVVQIVIQDGGRFVGRVGWLRSRAQTFWWTTISRQTLLLISASFSMLNCRSMFSVYSTVHSWHIILWNMPRRIYMYILCTWRLKGKCM